MIVSRTMKAIGLTRYLPISDPDSLIEFDLPKPVPGVKDLLVRVEAVSVNPVDTKVRAPKPAVEATPKILGWDAAGILEAIGPEVTLFKVGDPVFYAGTLDRQGTNAEFHLVDERIVGHKPESLSFAEAAALPLTSITAWELLFDRLGVTGGLAKSGHILIIGGAGGVGSILIQLARHLTGLTIIATASRKETREWCLELGAHHVIDHGQPINEELKRIGISEVEYVASLTATEHHFQAIVEAIRPQGKFAVIDDPATLDVKAFKRKAVSTHWEFMFTRPLYKTPDMIAQHRLLNEIARLIDTQVIRTTLADHFGTINAANLKKAHALIESGKSRGKIVLEGWR
jgi:NADPH2:quinone reductase